MCFRRTHKHQIDNNSPKVVYKVMRLISTAKVMPMHYYTNRYYSIGSTLRASKDVSTTDMDKLAILDGEVVHAYRDSHSILERTNRLMECTMLWPHPYSKAVDIALIECTIPAGTFYCMGVDLHRIPNYGALTIVPNRVIKILATVK